MRCCVYSSGMKNKAKRVLASPSAEKVILEGLFRLNAERERMYE